MKRHTVENCSHSKLAHTKLDIAIETVSFILQAVFLDVGHIGMSQVSRTAEESWKHLSCCIECILTGITGCLREAIFKHWEIFWFDFYWILTSNDSCYFCCQFWMGLLVVLYQLFPSIVCCCTTLCHICTVICIDFLRNLKWRIVPSQGFTSSFRFFCSQRRTVNCIRSLLVWRTITDNSLNFNQRWFPGSFSFIDSCINRCKVCSVFY